MQENVIQVGVQYCVRWYSMHNDYLYKVHNKLSTLIALISETSINTQRETQAARTHKCNIESVSNCDSSN